MKSHRRFNLHTCASLITSSVHPLRAAQGGAEFGSQGVAGAEDAGHTASWLAEVMAQVASASAMAFTTDSCLSGMLVVATARGPAGLHATLRQPGRLDCEVRARLSCARSVASHS